MHYHSNHCWCSQSNWDDNIYDSRHMVSISKYPNYEVGAAHYKQIIADDWTNCIVEVPTVSDAEYEFEKMWVESYKKDEVDDAEIKRRTDTYATRPCPTLRDEVITWLNENVKSSRRDERSNRPEGWCVGNDQYRMSGSLSELIIWFLRRNDALQFIKTWSVYKKPTTYLNYFDDDRRELIDGELVKVDRFTE